MTREIWKDVVGYEGLYQVSDRRRVKRVAGGGHGTRAGRILRQHRCSRTGYQQVSPYQDGRRATKKVHRLVAEAFLECPSPEREVNHRNGDRTDNRVENLEWVTRSENAKHSYAELDRVPPDLRGERNGKAKLTRWQVQRIRALYATGKYTTVQLGEMFDVSYRTIGQLLTGETWGHVEGPPKPLATRLTAAYVREIRRLYETGEYSQRKLGDVRRDAGKHLAHHPPRASVARYLASVT